MKFTIEEISKKIEDKGCKLISDIYFNNKTKLEIKFICGCYKETTYKNFQVLKSYKCKECVTLTCRICKQTKELNVFKTDKTAKYGKQSICKECHNKENSKRVANHTKDQIIDTILNRAKRRHFEFNITKKDVYDLLDKQKYKCAYSGRELIFKYNNKNKISIDRIDSNVGYIKSNCQLVCWCVNQAKNDLPDDDFLSLIKDIANLKIK